MDAEPIQMQHNNCKVKKRKLDTYLKIHINNSLKCIENVLDEFKNNIKSLITRTYYN